MCRAERQPDDEAPTTGLVARRDRRHPAVGEDHRDRREEGDAAARPSITPAPSPTPPRSSARSRASRSQPAARSPRPPSSGGAQARSSTSSTPAGLRAIAVQVDQVTGVGTVIKTGDYVDLIGGVTGDKFPVITVNPADDSVTVVSGLNSTSVKVLLQGLQVLGTLLPPAAQTTTHRRRHRRHRRRRQPVPAGDRAQRPAADRRSSRSTPSRPKSSSSPSWTPRSPSSSARRKTSSTRTSRRSRTRRRASTSRPSSTPTGSSRRKSSRP